MSLANKFSNLRTKPKVLIGVLSPLTFLLLLGGIAAYNINSINTSNKWVDHTHVVLADAKAIIASAVDMETGMRGYLLAGQEGFLDPYKSGEEATYAGITALKETVSDNPTQVGRLTEVETILRDWQKNVTEPNIDLRHKIGDAATMNDMAALVGEARGKVFFDAFRGQIATFVGREAELLEERHNAYIEAKDHVDHGLHALGEAERWVIHTHVVLAKASHILADAVDMETGMRGFLLGGQDEFLDPYNNGKTAFFEEIAALREVVSDNPAQVQLLTETEETIQNWVDKVTEPAIKLRRQVVSGSRSLLDIETLVRKKPANNTSTNSVSRLPCSVSVKPHLWANVRQKPLKRNTRPKRA